MALVDLLLKHIAKGESKLNIDDLITKIQHERIDQNRSFLYLVNQLYDNNKKEKKNQDEQLKKLLEKLFGSSDMKEFQSELGVRTSRYMTYRSMIKKISYAKRALQVITSEIISPNILNNQMLNITVDSDYEEDNYYKIVRNRIKKIIHDLTLEKKIKRIVRNTVLYGDMFVEIVNMSEELKRKEILQENLKLNENDNYSLSVNIYQDNYTELSILMEDSNNKDKTIEDDKNISIDDLMLIPHNPGIVVRLGEEVCLGYLVFPSELKSAPPDLNNKIYQMAMNSQNNGNLDDFLKKFKNELQKSQNIQKEIQISKDLKMMLVKMYLFYNNGFGDNKKDSVGIRYVKPESMVHFKLQSDELHPYGESIFYGLEFDAKLLVLFKVAITIMRLSRATEKRVIALEIDLDNDARNAINKIKESYEMRKFSIDNGGIDTMPSMVTSFENIYIPMKDGKRFIEFDTLNTGHDPGNAIEDYKSIRDSFVAGLPVPPAYLNLEENLESKSTLSHENIIFSKSVIDWQIDIEIGINEIVKRVYNMIFGETYEFVNVHFTRPKSIALESEREYYSTIADLMDILDRLKINKTKFIKKYIPSDLVDDEFDKVEYNINKNKNTGNEETGGFGAPTGGGF